MPSTTDPVADLQVDIRADITRVEQLLHETARSDHPKVTETALHLIKAGGKRFRPMLVLLGGALVKPEEERLIACGAAIELTHIATLYHDDVIEDATVRRGVPTANALYGNTLAVLTGDFLLARASGLAADLGPYVSRRLADTIAELCEGQILETEINGRLDVDPSAYLEVIKRKTASLIATSCHLGAWLAGASPVLVDAITTYGEALGMAFQLADDILDITGTEEELGKTPGTDLRVGVYTLPVLETLAGRAARDGDLRAVLERKDVEGAIELLRDNGSIELARSAVEEWEQRALDALAPVPESPIRDALARLARFTGARTR